MKHSSDYENNNLKHIDAKCPRFKNIKDFEWSDFAF